MVCESFIVPLPLKILYEVLCNISDATCTIDIVVSGNYQQETVVIEAPSQVITDRKLFAKHRMKSCMWLQILFHCVFQAHIAKFDAL